MHIKFLGLPVACALTLVGCDRDDTTDLERAGEQVEAQSEEMTNTGRPSMPEQDTMGAPTTEGREPTSGQEEPIEAKAELKTADGVELEGEAKLTSTGNGVQIEVELQDGKPGKQAVHIHEKGDCSDIKGESMGSHFDPRGHQHGLPTADQRHLGDLGNIEIGEDGKGKLTMTVREANLKEGDKMSFLGKALVVHSGEDTGKGKAGEAGTPVACGVIEKD